MKVLRLFLQATGAVTLLGALALTGLLFWAAEWLDVNDPPQHSDCIVPLAGDYHRLFKAAQLYKQGYAPTVMLSRARIHPPSRVDLLNKEFGHPVYAPYDYQMKILNHLGVPPRDVTPFGHGHISTLEEAEALREHIKQIPESLLIVTSPYHARRAKMIFGDVFPETTISVAVPPEGRFEKGWWKDQVSAQNIVLELAKMAHYLWGGAFRSTEAQLP